MLLFSYGTDGFHLDIPKDGKAKSVTAIEYYLDIVLCGKQAVFQQYVVNACAKMEQRKWNSSS